MPGTTLPLDTFEDVVPVTTASGSRLENENEIEASFAENPSDAKTGEKMAQLHALKSPDAGHVDHKTGEWHSDDPLNIPAEEDNAISPQFHLATAMIEGMHHPRLPAIYMYQDTNVSAELGGFDMPITML